MLGNIDLEDFSLFWVIFSFIFGITILEISIKMTETIRLRKIEFDSYNTSSSSNTGGGKTSSGGVQLVTVSGGLQIVTINGRTPTAAQLQAQAAAAWQPISLQQAQRTAAVLAKGFGYTPPAPKKAPRHQSQNLNQLLNPQRRNKITLKSHQMEEGAAQEEDQLLKSKLMRKKVKLLEAQLEISN